MKKKQLIASLEYLRKYYEESRAIMFERAIKEKNENLSHSCFGYCQACEAFVDSLEQVLKNAREGD